MSFSSPKDFDLESFVRVTNEKLIEQEKQLFDLKASHEKETELLKKQLNELEKQVGEMRNSDTHSDTPQQSKAAEDKNNVVTKETSSNKIPGTSNSSWLMVGGSLPPMYATYLPESNESRVGRVFYEDRHHVVEMTCEDGSLDANTLQCLFRQFQTKIVRLKEMKQGARYQVWFENEKDAIGIASEKTQEFMGKTIQVGLLDRPKPDYVILFSGVISEYRDTDLLERYLRSTKYGAGSPSLQILPQEKEDEFKVITQEPLTALVLLSRDLFKLGTDAIITPLPPLCAVKNLDNEEGNSKPITVPIEPSVAKYLKENSKLLTNIRKEIPATVSIDDHGNAVLEYCKPSLISQFESVLSNAVCNVMFDIPLGSTESIRPLVTQFCTQENIVFECISDYQISVTGTIESVIALNEKILAACAGQLILTAHEVILSVRDYVILTKVKKAAIESEFHDVLVLLNDSQRSLTISGPLKSVLKFKQRLPDFIGNMANKVIVEFAYHKIISL